MGVARKTNLSGRINSVTEVEEESKISQLSFGKVDSSCSIIEFVVELF